MWRRWPNGGRLEIGPLENLPVIKDLATDMRPFFEKWQQAKGAFVPSQDAARRDRADQAGQRAAHRRRRRHRMHQLRRLLCRLRYRALEFRLSRAGGAQSRLDARERCQRDAGNAERLQAVAASGGCQRCHSHQSCQEHCPQALNPTASIAGLKRRTMRRLSQGRAEGMSVRLYVWQRLTAALMVPLVLVHVAVIFYATRQGTDAPPTSSAARAAASCGLRSTASFVVAAADSCRDRRAQCLDRMVAA